MKSVPAVRLIASLGQLAIVGVSVGHPHFCPQDIVWNSMAFSHPRNQWGLVSGLLSVIKSRGTVLYVIIVE